MWKGPTSLPKSSPPNNVNNGAFISNGNISLKREDQIRRDVDNFKNYKVGLLEVDTTIFEHLRDHIKPTVVENGEKFVVPVMMADPERWNAIQQNGFMRDQNGKILRPVISLKRTSTSNRDPLSSNRYLTYQIEQKYSIKNRYDRFNLLNKHLEPPVKEIYNIIMPDKITVLYEVVVWTNKIQQMNEIIEKVNFATHDYWGIKEGYKFRTEVSDYSHQTELNADQDRIIKTTFTLTVFAKLLPEFFEDGTPTTQRRLNPRKLVVGEVLSNVNTMPTTQTSQNNLDSRFVDPNKNSTFGT